MRLVQILLPVRDECLYTPPMSSGILPGITRDTVMTMAHDLGIDVREQVLPREFLYLADELFLCGTAAEITPIRSVDRIAVGSGKPGPITQNLQREYSRIVRGQSEDRHGWLTHVREVAAVAHASGSNALHR